MWEIVTLGSTPYPGIAAADVMRKVCNRIQIMNKRRNELGKRRPEKKETFLSCEGWDKIFSFFSGYDIM